MSTTYRTAGQEVETLAAKIIKRQYPDLLTVDATIRYLFVRNSDGPAITKNSWPALALVKVNNLRDRVAGLTDATILIDEEQWEEWSEERRIAIIDHELMHLDIKRNKVGAFLYDDANRPRMRCKPHDFECGGFHAIVQRHGIEAPEAATVEGIHAHWVQNQFGIFQEA